MQAFLENKIKSLNKKYKSSLGKNKINFFSGDCFLTVSNLTAEYAPYGKIAVVYTKSGYENLSKQATSLLINNKNKPLSVIMPDDTSDNLKIICKLFDLPDDVRMVVTFENSLFKACSYFSGIRNIPLIISLTTPSIYSILSPIFYLVDGVGYTKSLLSNNTLVVIDGQRILEQKKDYNLYAEIESCLLCLIDYTLSCSVEGQRLDTDAYELLSKAITSTFKILTLSREQQLVKLIENAFLLELANLKTDGKLYDNSVLSCIEKLVGDRLTGRDRLTICKRILKLLSLFCGNSTSSIKANPDYNLRAEKISEFMKIDDGYFLNNFLTQQKYLTRRKYLKAKKILGVKSSKLLKTVERMGVTYNALGATDQLNSTLCNLAIKYSGDIFPRINCGVILRESGILEYL